MCLFIVIHRFARTTEEITKIRKVSQLVLWERDFNSCLLSHILPVKHPEDLVIFREFWWLRDTLAVSFQTNRKTVMMRYLKLSQSHVFYVTTVKLVKCIHSICITEILLLAIFKRNVKGIFFPTVTTRTATFLLTFFRHCVREVFHFLTWM